MVNNFCKCCKALDLTALVLFSPWFISQRVLSESLHSRVAADFISLRMFVLPVGTFDDWACRR